VKEDAAGRLSLTAHDNYVSNSNINRKAQYAKEATPTGEVRLASRDVSWNDDLNSPSTPSASESTPEIPPSEPSVDPSLHPHPVGEIRDHADKIVVQTWDLTKRYGSFEALADCSLRVARGEVFGLLGPNGAGKTTLIRLMLGFLRPTSGYCVIDGHDSRTDGVTLRQKVAYLPGDARLPRHMRGSGVLKFFADMHPLGDLSRSRDIARRLELDTRRRVGSMSTGMRQKLALSVVLGLRTPVLILDEPTANLDPSIRAEVLRLVVEAQQSGRTVMFSSHVLGEIEETCNRVVFLRHGRLVHELTMAELFQRHRITGWMSHDAQSIEIPEAWKSQTAVEILDHDDRSHVRIDTAGDLAPLLPWLHALELKNLRIEPLGLRAVYDSVHHGEDTSALEDEV